MAITGTTNLDSLELSGNLTVAGTVTTTGGEVNSGSLTVTTALAVGSNTSLTGALAVTGSLTQTAAASFGSNVVITGTASITGNVAMAAGLAVAGTCSVSGALSWGNNSGITTSAASTAVRIDIANTSASSGSALVVLTAQTGGADPYTRYEVNGGTTWTVGVDNSNSDCFAIKAASTLDTDAVFIIGAGGSVNIGATGGTNTHTINTNNVTTVGSAGTAAALPTPLGYIPVNIGTVSAKIAIFNP